MLLKQRNRLLIHKQVAPRPYLTKASPNISKLYESRQPHSSHWTGDHCLYRFLQTKFLKNTTWCLRYQAWGATTMCWMWKGGDWTKEFEKHCSRASWRKLNWYVEVERSIANCINYFSLRKKYVDIYKRPSELKVFFLVYIGWSTNISPMSCEKHCAIVLFTWLSLTQHSKSKIVNGTTT